MRAKRGKSDEGYTLVEAAAAIAVIALLALIGYSAVATATRAVTRYADEARFSERLVLLEATLRSSLARVETPFWAATTDPTLSPTTASFAWVDSDPSSILQVSWEAPFVVFEGEGMVSRIGPFDGAELKLLRNADGTASGLSIRVARGTRWFEAGASFASLALALKGGG